MSWVLKINDIDRSADVSMQQFKGQNAITSQTDTLTFLMEITPNLIQANLDDEIKLIADGVTLFAGTIVESYSEVKPFSEVIRYTCKDFSFALDKVLIAQSFQDTNINEIIDFIILEAGGGYTRNGAVVDFDIAEIRFNYERPTNILKQLAKLTNCDWYVDEEKDIKFFKSEDNAAPFNLNDTNHSYDYKTLTIKNSITKVSNVVVVEGGEYAGLADEWEQVADGEQKAFTLPKRIKNLDVYLDGVQQTVGIQNVDDAALFDCVYNYSEKVVIFPTVITAGVVFKAAGNPVDTLIMELRDPNSIATYGSCFKKITDKSLTTYEMVQSRAQAEIDAYGEDISESKFTTSKAGLRAGQSINVQSTRRNIDKDFIITKVVYSPINPDVMQYEVSLATKEDFGIIQFLQNLLLQNSKAVEENTNEIIEKITLYSDRLKFKDGHVWNSHTQTNFKWTEDNSTANHFDWGFGSWNESA